MMNLKQIKEIAKTKGINGGKMKKDELIRSIQKTEGNFDCFGTAGLGHCSQEDCLWREDCIKGA
ncbi:MAG: Rho termination factor N-terminal domain-containing protein [Nitrospiraceae bacterium]|nr:Rho termination factor N-terminal domain-containing protein [Nitrospiraceae bacterium]